MSLLHFSKDTFVALDSPSPYSSQLSLGSLPCPPASLKTFPPPHTLSWDVGHTLPVPVDCTKTPALSV